MGDISVAFVKQFGANLDMLVQQKGSVLRPAVRIESIGAEERYFDQLGATAAVKKTTRNSDTPLIKSDHQRRKVVPYDFEWADLLDKEDKLKTLIDPTSNYAQSAAWALGRSMDDEIITAMGGTAYSGKAGGTSVTFPSGNKVAAGSAGLTIAKLLSAKEILDGADVDPAEQRFCVVTASQLSDLLNTTQVTSADYNSVRALVNGQVDTFLGFKFLMCNRLGVDGSSNRLVYVWAKSAVLLALGKEINTKIDPRPDKSYATQVYACMTCGATRMEEEKIAQIACVES